MLIYKMLLYGGLILLFIICERRKKAWNRQVLFEMQFTGYLSTVASAYGKNQNIADALWETGERQREGLPEENLYVRIFGEICEVVQKNGDIRQNGTSLFIQNIQQLNEILHEQQILHKNRQYLFLGLDYLSFIPVFFLPIVEWWAKGITEELTAFYRGSYGILLYGIIVAATAVLYLLIIWLMLPYVGETVTYRFEKRLLGNRYCAKLIDGYINRHYGACRKKNELLKELQGYGNIREFLMRKFCFGIFGWLPELYLVISKWKSRDKRMEEALRMQTVVLILAHYEEVTIEELLESMERFAEIFKQPLAEAVDEFSYQRNDAIEKLKEEITDEPMQRIFDALLFCEELPLKEAMYHLEGERTYYLKSYIEEQKKNQQEYAAAARLIAYIPLFLVLLLGLVVPFTTIGLRELSMYQEYLTGVF